MDHYLIYESSLDTLLGDTCSTEQVHILAAAKKGEKIYIGGFGKPEVLLVKISDQENTALNKRVFTIGKGKIIAKANAFSDITDKDIAALMLKAIIDKLDFDSSVMDDLPKWVSNLFPQVMLHFRNMLSSVRTIRILLTTCSPRSL